MEFSLNNNWIEMHPSMKSTVDALEPFARHALYWQCCQKIFQAQTGRIAQHPNDIREKGFTICRNILGSDDIAAGKSLIDEALDRETEPFEPTPDGPSFTANLLPEDKATAAKVLFNAFTGKLENLLYDFFGSQFLIRSTTLGRLFPCGEARHSYVWHRDWEVAHQVHVIIYLTDLSETTGSTELLSVEDTRIAQKAGYDYPPVDQRLPDLSDHFQSQGKEFSPYRIDAKAGDALIFTSARNLHKGALPIVGHRDTLLSVVHPCPSSWQLTLQNNFLGTFGLNHAHNCRADPFAYFAGTGDSPSMPDWVRNSDLGPPA